jgi:hypothetical protein
MLNSQGNAILVSASSIVVRNNIISNMSGYVVMRVLTSLTGQALVVDNNVIEGVDMKGLGYVVQVGQGSQWPVVTFTNNMIRNVVSSHCYGTGIVLVGGVVENITYSNSILAGKKIERERELTFDLGRCCY